MVAGEKINMQSTAQLPRVVHFPVKTFRPRKQLCSLPLFGTSILIHTRSLDPKHPNWVNSIRIKTMRPSQSFALGYREALLGHPKGTISPSPTTSTMFLTSPSDRREGWLLWEDRTTPTGTKFFGTLPPWGGPPGKGDPHPCFCTIGRS